MNTVAIPNTATKTVSVELPAAEYRFLKTLSEKMGWITKIVKNTKKEKNGLDPALEDIKKGDYVSFDNVDDAIAYLNS